MPVFVNNDEISDDDIHQEIQYHPASTVEKAQEYAIQALVIKKLLYKTTQAKGLIKKEGLEAQEEAITQLLKLEVLVPQATMESDQQYYSQNKHRFCDKETGDTLPFEQVQEKIRHYLYAQSFQTGIKSYIRSLASRAKIVGFTFDETF